MALYNDQMAPEQLNQERVRLQRQQHQQQQAQFKRSFSLGLCGPKKTRRSLIDYLSSRSRAPYYYNHERAVNLARNYSPFLYRMNLMKKLPVHEGCVNTICWNKTGEYILSGSDDCNLCITKPAYLFDSSKDYTVLHKIPTRHSGNIFSAQFLPNSNDSLLVSCSSDGPVIVHDINSENPSQGVFNFHCHSSTIFEVVPLQDDDKVFLSCGEDKTVRLFDIRCHRSCGHPGTCPHPALIRNSHPVTTLSVHPLDSNLILAGRADGVGLVYDRRKLPDPAKFSREKAHADYLASRQQSGFKQHQQQQQQQQYLHPLEGVVSKFSVPDMEEKCRFTSLCFSQEGRQVLASYSQDYVYLFNYDKSSNFELIQTLPWKYEKRPDEGNPVNINCSSNSGPGNQVNDMERNGSDNLRGRVNSFLRTSTRAPRIRVRGDWSDTGVNSVPQSVRPEFMEPTNTRSRQLRRHAQNLLERITPRLFPLAEIFADQVGLFSGNDSTNAATNTTTSSTNERTVDDVEEEEEGVEEDNEMKSDGDNHDDDDSDSSDKVSMKQQQGQKMNSTTANNSSDESSTSPQNRLKDKFRNLVSDLKKYDKIDAYCPHVRYQGHRNSRTSIKKAIFWGENYIMSGSDCGRIMVWEKETARLVMAFPADERVVNCLAQNPCHYALASSGIDYDIKLWSTQHIIEYPLRIGEEEMYQIVNNNELMLEEAKQTIVVPPHLFFRVLASFAQNRLS